MSVTLAFSPHFRRQENAVWDDSRLTCTIDRLPARHHRVLLAQDEVVPAPAANVGRHEHHQVRQGLHTSKAGQLCFQHAEGKETQQDRETVLETRRSRCSHVTVGELMVCKKHYISFCSADLSGERI